MGRDRVPLPTKFIVTATDLADNKSKDNETWDTYIDQTPPAPPTNIQIKSRTEDTAIITWDRSPDIDVAQYAYQLEVNGERVNTGTTTPFPQATVHIVPKATIAVMIKSIDKAKNESKATSKTGRIQSSSSLHRVPPNNPDMQDCPEKNSPCGKLDRSQVTCYALAWADCQNYKLRKHLVCHSSDWPIFTNDCTNFVSQVLYAGGMNFRREYSKHSEAWWAGRYPQAEHTVSWSVSQAFYEFLLKSGMGKEISHERNFEAGDVIFFDWNKQEDSFTVDHAGVIARSNDVRENATYTQHSQDRLTTWAKQLGDINHDKHHRYEPGTWSYKVIHIYHTKSNVK